MKPKEFAVSVIFGSGFHYFRAYKDTWADAKAMANWVQEMEDKAYKSRGKKGAKPTVHVWKMI
jgi:hypothetical protein